MGQFLKDNYDKVTQPADFIFSQGGLSGDTEIKIGSSLQTLWTVDVVGSGVGYEVQIKATGSTTFRKMENNIIDGTTAGTPMAFMGTCEAILVITNGDPYFLSIVGRHQS